MFCERNEHDKCNLCAMLKKPKKKSVLYQCISLLFTNNFLFLISPEFMLKSPSDSKKLYWKNQEASSVLLKEVNVPTP